MATESAVMAEAEEEQQYPVLAAFGNPLLDIIVPDEDGLLVDTFRRIRDGDRSVAASHWMTALLTSDL